MVPAIGSNGVHASLCSSRKLHIWELQQEYIERINPPRRLDEALVPQASLHSERQATYKATQSAAAEFVRAAILQRNDAVVDEDADKLFLPSGTDHLLDVGSRRERHGPAGAVAVGLGRRLDGRVGQRGGGVVQAHGAENAGHVAGAFVSNRGLGAPALSRGGGSPGTYLSCEKSANRTCPLPIGKVALDASRVWLTLVWSWTGLPVKRAISSFVNPTPCVGPSALPLPLP